MVFSFTREEGPGEEPTFSKSQHETWLDCRRKWGFQKLDRIEKSTPQAQDGNRIHSILERWVGAGEQIEDTWWGHVAAEGISYLPLPKDKNVEVEVPFYWRSPGGFWYHGYIDMLDNRKSRPVIWDYKTTSDFMWMLSEEELRSDRSAFIYSGFVFEFFDVEKIDLKWLYFLRNKKKPKVNPPVHVTLSREHVLKNFNFIDAVSEEIYREGLVKSEAKELPPNLAACGKYGGCPYRGSECVLSTEETFAAGFVALRRKTQQQQARRTKDMASLDQIKKSLKKSNGSVSKKTAQGRALDRVKKRSSSREEDEDEREEEERAAREPRASKSADGTKAASNALSRLKHSKGSDDEDKHINAPEGPEEGDEETDPEVVAETAQRGQQKPKSQGRERKTAKSDESSIFAKVFIAAFEKIPEDVELEEALEICGQFARGAVDEYRKL